LSIYVIMVVDKSGSMYALADDVRGGFNEYIEGLKNDQEIDYRVSVFMFNHDYDELVNAVRLSEVPVLNDKNYHPGGNTALLDAIGKSIIDFEHAVPNLNDGDRVLFVVQTDGFENSSREFSNETIAKMIKTREASDKWGFVFLGAGPEVWAQSQSMGFQYGSPYKSTSGGTRSAYSSMMFASGQFSRGASAASVAETVAAGQEEIDEE
jgi:Mg-chelatase subunit ChlD